MCDKIKDFFNKISKPSLFYFSVETTVLSVLFDKVVKKRWLPVKKRNDCFVVITSSEDEMKKQNIILFGIKGNFTKVIKLDTNRFFNDWLKHDNSYIIEIMYYILSEMKIEECFAEHIDVLARIINDKQESRFFIDESPF